MKKLKPTIGMETHVELRTRSKMFCGCPSDHFGKPPNTQTCPVCLGLPGALPVPNKRAVEWTIMLGLALNCSINRTSKFDRKHYFYPDLPKGYQISQYDEPLCVGGYLATKEGKIRINRVHLEEDTGKLQHKKINGKNVTLIDFNRSGVALVEVVTEPDIHSGTQAKDYAQKLQSIIRYLEISDCDMEKGSMRVEANISLGLKWGYKVEVKNLNSFRFMDRAINYELERQKKLLLKGIVPNQETRGWNESKNKTFTQRFKEVASDYRYFPEPDIPPMKFSEGLLRKIKNSLPLLPDGYAKKLIDEYGIRKDYADILSSNKKVAEFSEKALKEGKKRNVSPQAISNYLVNRKLDIQKENIAEFIKKVTEKEKEKEFTQDDNLLKEWVSKAIAELPEAVKDYKRGKLNAVYAIVGHVMKISKGKSDPQTVKRLIEANLNKV